jgi:hypothetical protein
VLQIGKAKDLSAPLSSYNGVEIGKVHADRRSSLYKQKFDRTGMCSALWVHTNRKWQQTDWLSDNASCLYFERLHQRFANNLPITAESKVVPIKGDGKAIPVTGRPGSHIF